MDLVSRFLESRSKSPSQACCRMCCGICILWILLVSKNPKPLQDGRYKKTTARVVLQQNLWPGTPQDTPIKSGILARLPLQLYTKLYTKIFACLPKVTFPASRFLHPETVSPVGYFLIPFKKLVQLVQNAQPIEFKG